MTTSSETIRAASVSPTVSFKLAVSPTASARKASAPGAVGGGLKLSKFRGRETPRPTKQQLARALADRPSTTPEMMRGVAVGNGTNAYTPSPNHMSESGETTTPISSMKFQPKQSINEAMSSLTSIAVAQLEEIWDEVGYNPDERGAQMSDLFLEFRDMYERKVAEERGVAETFRQTILDAKVEIATKTKALQRDCDPRILHEEDGNSKMTLTDELASLETALEEIRAAAEIATTEMTKYRNKLLEAHNALGTQMEPEWDDIETDLTQKRRDQFRAKVAEMNEIVSSRTQAIVQLLQDCQSLIRELELDRSDCKEHYEEFCDLDQKIMTSLTAAKGAKTVTIGSVYPTDDCTGISDNILSALTQRVSELNTEKKRRKRRLGELGQDIAALWAKLRVPNEEQQSFTAGIRGLGMDTIRKGEQELSRLHELKAEMMGKLISEARDAIIELWDETNATAEHREKFQAFQITDNSLYTDDLLSEHEEYIVILEARKEKMLPILELIEKRERILKERMEYEEFQKDPERLQQRGAALTKQLMREEKMARRIKKDLPKMTDLLERKLNDWKRVNGEDFISGGEIYLGIMRSQEEEWQAYKDNEKHLKLKLKQEEMSAESGRPSDSMPVRKRASSAPKSSMGSTSSHNSDKTSVAGGNHPLMDAGSKLNRTRDSSRGRDVVPHKIPMPSRQGRAASRSMSRGRHESKPLPVARTRGQSVGPRPLPRS